MNRYFEVVSDKFHKNKGNIILPTRATKSSIAYDFYSPVDDSVSALEFILNGINNLYIIKDKTTPVWFGEYDNMSLLVPWYEFDKKEQISQFIEEYKPKYILGYSLFRLLTCSYRRSNK